MVLGCIGKTTGMGDVFSDSREKEGILVVSPSQALLDLAGLGYSGKDITKAMLEKYASL